MKRTDDSPRMIVGRQPVIVALRSSDNVQEVLVASGPGKKGALKDIEGAARAAGVRVRRVDVSELDRASNGVLHQGVIAKVAPYQYLSIDDLLHAELGDDRIDVIAVLDGVTDPRNLGAVIRSAEASGIRGIVIPERRSAQVNEAATKASAGADASMPIAMVGNSVDAVRRLQQEGYWVLGTDAEAEVSIWEADLTGPTVIVLGSEGKGVRPLLKSACDQQVSIPIHGEVESLNVSVSAALLFYEARRRASSG